MNDRCVFVCDSDYLFCLSFCFYTLTDLFFISSLDTHGQPVGGFDKRQLCDVKRKSGRRFFPIISVQDLFTKSSVGGAAKQFEVPLVNRHCRFDFINNNSLISLDCKFKETTHEHNYAATYYIL